MYYVNCNFVLYQYENSKNHLTTYNDNTAT